MQKYIVEQHIFCSLMSCQMSGIMNSHFTAIEYCTVHTNIFLEDFHKLFHHIKFVMKEIIKVFFFWVRINFKFT